MKRLKNLRDKRNPISADEVPPWFRQLIHMDEKHRQKAVDSALKKLKEAKPDAYAFIKDNDCELIGFIPNISYTLPFNEDGNLDVKYLHDFSQYTLLYWCKQAKFAFLVNASMDYNANGLRGLIY